MRRWLASALGTVILFAGIAGCSRQDDAVPTLRRIPTTRFPMQKGLEQKGAKAKP
jgi:hypothetical protein